MRSVATIERNPVRRLLFGLPVAETPQMQMQQRLGFPVRLMKSCRVPTRPQAVGDKWWLEVYQAGIMPPYLPERARMRWLRACGQGLVGTTLVYHEVREAQLVTKPHEPSQLERSIKRAYRFFEQTLPGQLEHLAMQWKLHESQIKRVGLVALMVVAALVAVAALMPVVAAATAVGVAVHDPVLVVVTPDGQWVELDRWDE